MKPGDLVVTTDGLGLNLCSAPEDYFRNLGIKFGWKEVATVLEVRYSSQMQIIPDLAKVIAPEGVGWCYIEWLKVV